MKHKWEPVQQINGMGCWPGEQHCSICGKYVDSGCDPIDSPRIAKWLKEIKQRNDCKGKPQ